MAWVYILRGSSGRHYIGSCIDLNSRFAQHLRGHTATTKRLGSLQIIAQKEFPTLGMAREVEKSLKRKKNPRIAIYYLQRYNTPESFRGWSGVQFSPLAFPYSFF